MLHYLKVIFGFKIISFHFHFLFVLFDSFVSQTNIGAVCLWRERDATVASCALHAGMWMMMDVNSR